ncbi:unnamed protein product, partial [Polarella glacialis]
VPERHLEEMQQLDPEEGGGQMSSRYDRWLSELRVGSEVYYERCSGEEVMATVTGIYPEEDSCRVEYMARVDVEGEGSSEHRLRSGLVRLSVLAEIQRRSGWIQEVDPDCHLEAMARAPPPPASFEQSPETWPGPPVEERAMRLRELQDLGRLIKARCEAESWLDQRSGQLLEPGSVNLYHLNYYVICPCTVPEGVLLRCSGIDPRKAVPGQRVVQSDPKSRNTDNVLAEGVIHGTRTVGGQDLLIVSKQKGQFRKEPGSNLTVGLVSSQNEVDVRPNQVSKPGCPRSTTSLSLSYQEFLRFRDRLEPEAVEPRWFCSHWWGEAVLDFICCCEKHAQVRLLGNDSAYWVCAYANRQH